MNFHVFVVITVIEAQLMLNAVINEDLENFDVSFHHY